MVWSTLFQFKDKWGIRDQCFDCASRGFQREAGKMQNSDYDA
eukprot:gene47398-12393_t